MADYFESGNIVTPQNRGICHNDGVTDDSALLQDVFEYAAENNLPVLLRGSYAIANPLTLLSNLEIRGVGGFNTCKIISSVDGPALQLAAGIVQGVGLRGVTFNGNPQNSNSIGWSFVCQANAQGIGGLWDSCFEDCGVALFGAQQILIQGGGGASYNYTRPEQFVRFLGIALTAQPGQNYTVPLLDVSGQSAQTIFKGGEYNGSGQTTHTGPLVSLHADSTGVYGPGLIRFLATAVQNGDLAFQVENANNVFIDQGYMENTNRALLVGNSNVRMHGSTINTAAAGVNVVEFAGSSHGDICENDLSYLSSTVPANWIKCTSSDSVRERRNRGTGALNRTGITKEYNAGANLTVVGDQALINSISGANPTLTLTANDVGCGEEVTLRAFNGPVVFTKNTGSNGGNLTWSSSATTQTLASGQTVKWHRWDLLDPWTMGALSV